MNERIPFETAPSPMPAARRIRRRWAAAALLMTALATQAQTGLEEDSDDKGKAWQEAEVQLPPAPQPADLLPVYGGPTATLSFAIDAKSISVGADGVVRYTLVATSNAGAKNVSYEGIRCATYEKKAYAFGQQDGSWIRSRRDGWQRIPSHGGNRPQAVLAKNYFCELGSVAGTAKDMIERIRYQRSLAEPEGGGA